MNKERVIVTARKYLKDIQEVFPNVYRGEYKIDKLKPLGVYYLDFNNVQPVDFKKYQEKLLAKDYFSNSGNLQWNYYLLIFQDNVPTNKRKEIERDDSYARKYFLDENEFEVFFEPIPHKKGINNDIIAKWKLQLDEAGLQEVYGKEYYSHVYQRFIEGKAKTVFEEINLNSLTSDEVLRIENISRLIFNSYRPSIKKREFNFKKVNLIRGINGSGKTSLFEAIELIICGLAGRNKEKLEQKGAIEATFNNNDKVIYDPGNNTMYRKREMHWYFKNGNSKGNDLYQSFNRYNFYNSDAAYEFSTGGRKQIKEALRDIIMGPEFNIIRERAAKVHEFMRKDYNRIVKEIELNEKNIINTRTKIDELKKSNKIEEISSTIIKLEEKLRIRKKVINIKESYLTLETYCNMIFEVIKKIKELSNIVRSKKDLNDFNEDLEKKKKIIEDKSKRYNQVQININELSNLEINLKENLRLIETSLKYFADYRFFKISRSKEKFANIKQSLGKISIIEEKIKLITLEKYKSDKTILELKNELELEIHEKTKEISEIESEITEKQNNYDRLDLLLREIKKIGMEFININKHAKSCPLCNAEYEFTELKKRIERISDLDTNNENYFIELYKKSSLLTKKIDDVKYKLENIELIESSYRIINDSVAQNLPMESILLEIETYINNKGLLIKKLGEIDEIFELQKNNNISENEFLELRGSILNTFPDLNFTFENKKDFLDLREKLLVEISSNKNDSTKLKNEKVQILSEVVDLLGISLEVSDISELDLFFNTRLYNAKEINNLFDSIEEIINLDPNDSIDNLEINFSILQSNINSLKGELKNQFELEMAQQDEENLIEWNIENKKTFGKLQIGKQTLQSILETDDKEILGGFLESNSKEILAIFKSIHYPKEFSEIKMDENDVILVDDNGENRRITQISSGQRAALAISIFITLNRKLPNGPNLIMFDDPVSLIDDFNTLSFLDYLRYIAVHENKQIFLATANASFASLFEKKFEFLDTEFFNCDLGEDVSNF